MSTGRSGAAHPIPAEVVAAIAAAIAATIGKEPAELLFALRGPLPQWRTDAGSYHLAGRLHPSSLRRGGRA